MQSRKHDFEVKSRSYPEISKWNLKIKPGLLIVVTIAEHTSDDAPKRILRLSTHRMQIFLVKYEYQRSSLLCEDQVPRGKPKKGVCSHVLAILMSYMETRLET